MAYKSMRFKANPPGCLPSQEGCYGVRKPAGSIAEPIAIIIA